MKNVLALLLLLPSLALAQMYGPPYNPSNTQINGQPAGTMANQNANAVAITGGTAAFTGTVSTTGNLNVQGSINSTQNTNPASITNSGVALTAAPNVADVVYYDSTKATDNHIGELIWFQGCLQSRFKSDAQSSAVTPFSVCGGYGSGITGISSNSGSGSFTNTGPLGVTQSNGNGIVLTPSANGGTPTLMTNGANVNVSLNISTQGSGGINLNSATSVTGNLSVSGTSTLTGAVSMPGGTTGPLTISQGYTVAGLPTCNTASKGARAFVTDAANPTWNSPVTGGSSNTIGVLCNGNTWVGE
jgi:hypothetical protein